MVHNSWWCTCHLGSGCRSKTYPHLYIHMFCEVDNWEQLYKLFKKKNIGACHVEERLVWEGSSEEGPRKMPIGFKLPNPSVTPEMIGDPFWHWVPQKQSEKKYLQTFYSICFWKNIQQEVIQLLEYYYTPRNWQCVPEKLPGPKRKFIFQPSIFKSKPLVSGRVHKQKASFFFDSNDSQGCWKSPGGRSDPPTQGGGFIFPPSLFRLKNVCQVFATPRGD